MSWIIGIISTIPGGEEIGVEVMGNGLLKCASAIQEKEACILFTLELSAVFSYVLILFPLQSTGIVGSDLIEMVIGRWRGARMVQYLHRTCIQRSNRIPLISTTCKITTSSRHVPTPTRRRAEKGAFRISLQSLMPQPCGRE